MELSSSYWFFLGKIEQWWTHPTKVCITLRTFKVLTSTWLTKRQRYCFLSSSGHHFNWNNNLLIKDFFTLRAYNCGLSYWLEKFHIVIIWIIIIKPFAILITGSILVFISPLKDYFSNQLLGKMKANFSKTLRTLSKITIRTVNTSRSGIIIRKKWTTTLKDDKI